MGKVTQDRFFDDYKNYNVEFIVGKYLKGMTHLTRDVLIKSIVATEMQTNDGQDYAKQLKETKHKWEHASSEELCKRYNQINSVITVTVDQLNP